ncbi:MAG: DsbA family protein [Anaerolineales bacterium]|nr:DsbA family protein [Anaerolineales bacterium]
MSENTMPTQASWEIDSPPTEPELLPTQDEPAKDLGEEQDNIILRRSHLYAMLLPLAFVVGLSVGYLFWGRAGAIPTTAATTTGAAVVAPETNAEAENPAQTTGQTNPQADTQTADTQEIVRYDVPIDDDPFFGPATAPITIIEFSDFECPYCRKWHVEVFQRLLDTYPDQIKFVYRDFPLTSIHPNAFSAAEAANCAGDQGVYWPYHEQLFSMQLGLSQDAYTQYAEQLGLDMATFGACIAEGKHKDEIQADFEYAAQLGVRSTPTFFINGIAVVGAQPYDVFQQVIEKELAGEIP